MANERTYPCLPCPEIDPAIGFYEALGFRRTYRQTAPNPYAVVQWEDIQVHLFGIPGFDPAESYGNAIVNVPDVDVVYQAFAAGLRKAYGKLPTAGFPRITRPRKMYGTTRGFSVVDVGGNWLRFSRLGEKEDRSKAAGLAGVLDVAARLGDAHGDPAWALKTLESGLERFPDAPVLAYARAMLYRTEIAVRLGDAALARASLAAALARPMSDEDRAAIEGELAQAEELVRDMAPE